MDPTDGPYSQWTDEDYWGSGSALTHIPMQNLPYFSLCSRGQSFGKLPPTNDYGPPYADEPFTLGMAEIFGGSPVRKRGPRVKCQCLNELQPTFEVSCPPPGYTGIETDCYIVPNRFDQSDSREVQFQHVHFDELIGNDQHHLIGDWTVGPNCEMCAQAGVPKGDPWPEEYIRKDADGNRLQLPGWDSRAPLLWIFENPEACHLVSTEDTKHIGEWEVFEVKRYSDACDYVMTCMCVAQRLTHHAGPPSPHCMSVPSPHCMSVPSPHCMSVPSALLTVICVHILRVR